MKAAIIGGAIVLCIVLSIILISKGTSYADTILYSKTGERIGKIQDDGTIRGRRGNRLGRITSDNRVYDHKGEQRTLGRLFPELFDVGRVDRPRRKSRFQNSYNAPSSSRRWIK